MYSIRIKPLKIKKDFLQKKWRYRQRKIMFCLHFRILAPGGKNEKFKGIFESCSICESANLEVIAAFTRNLQEMVRRTLELLTLTRHL